MAKADKKAKKQGKAAGVSATVTAKLPKKLRKAGAKAIKLAGQPVVSEIVAAALLSAAAALRDGKGARGGAGAAGKSAKSGESLRKLAIDLARRTLDSWDRQTGAGKAPAGGTKARKTKGKSAKPQ